MSATLAHPADLLAPKSHGVDLDTLATCDALVLPSASWFGVDWSSVLASDGHRAVVAEAHELPGYRTSEADLAADEAASACRNGQWPIHHGLDTRETCRGSLACLHNGLDDVDDPIAAWPVIERFVRTLEAYLHAFAHAPRCRTVVVCNGLHHDGRAAVEAARLAGRHALAVESCCFPGLMYAETLTGITGNQSSLGRLLADRLRARPFTDDRRRRTMSFLRTHLANRMGADAPSAEAIRSELRIPEDNRILLMLGQVRSDTTLAYDAPVVDRATDLAARAFEAVRDDPTWTLVIKPHPKEVAGRDPAFHRSYDNATYAELASLPFANHERVRLLAPDQLNVYALMAAADAAITITSQSALEFVAGFARPAVVVGDAFFARAGFTVDVAHRSGVVPAVRELLRSPTLDSQAHEHALRFVDAMVHEHLVPINTPMPQSSINRLLTALGFTAHAEV